jgi:hypothetical protein
MDLAEQGFSTKPTASTHPAETSQCLSVEAMEREWGANSTPTLGTLSSGNRRTLQGDRSV